MAKITPLEDGQLESLVSEAIKDAVDFIDSEIVPERVLSQQYYDGKTRLGVEEGRSKVVATKCRDAVRSLKPSLLRVFLGQAPPVEFTPNMAEDVPVAEQMTKYVHYKLNKLNYFKLLSNAFQDCLVKRLGILKVYYEDFSKTETHTYSGLSDIEFNYLVADENVTVLNHNATISMEMDQATGQEIEKSVHDAKIQRITPAGDCRIDSVPPEEWFCDRNAKDVETAYIVGHRVNKTVGELVEQGFNFDDIHHLDAINDDSLNDAELFARTGFTEDKNDSQNNIDITSKRIGITECYMKVDVDGTGVPILHQFIMGGSNYKLLNYMPCDQQPFAVFECDPEPHTVWGRSVVAMLFDDQDASTSCLRGVLDNIALCNSPRLSVVDSQVNLDDVLNNEIGAVIRTRQPNTISPISIPFTAGNTLGAMQYLDQTIDQKVGVSASSVGLNPDVLQSTTKTAVDHHIATAQGQVETIARNLAEGGMTQLFRKMMHLIIKHRKGDEIMRMNNNYIPVDPKSWNAHLDLQVSVGLGTGKIEEKQMTLQQILQIQQTIYQGYGSGNGLVNLSGIKNCLTDILANSGIRNADRYFSPMTPEIEQQMMAMAQQQAQNQPQPIDPATAVMQTEQIRAQAKMQSDMAKLGLEREKMMLADDLKRDELDQNLLLKAGELLSKHGYQVDVNEIKRMQAQERNNGQVARN